MITVLLTKIKVGRHGAYYIDWLHISIEHSLAINSFPGKQSYVLFKYIMLSANLLLKSSLPLTGRIYRCTVREVTLCGGWLLMTWVLNKAHTHL